MVGNQGALRNTGVGVVKGFDEEGNPLLQGSNGTHIVLEFHDGQLQPGFRTRYDVLSTEGMTIYASSKGYEAKAIVDTTPHTNEQGVDEAVTGIQTLLDEQGEKLPSKVQRKLLAGLSKLETFFNNGKYSRAANQAGSALRLLERGSSNGAGQVYEALQEQYQSLVQSLGR